MKGPMKHSAGRFLSAGYALSAMGQGGADRAEDRGKDCLGGRFPGPNTLLICSLRVLVAWEPDSRYQTHQAHPETRHRWINSL